VVIVDPETGTRYRGKLRPETSPDGYEIQLLILTPEKGGVPIGVQPNVVRPLILVEATLDEISRLDGAGYRLRAAPRRASPRR
jgi:hypothetical protein